MFEMINKLRVIIYLLPYLTFLLYMEIFDVQTWEINICVYIKMLSTIGFS